MLAHVSKISKTNSGILRRQIYFLGTRDIERLLEQPLNINPKFSAKGGSASGREIRNSKEGHIIILRDKALLELLCSTGLRVSELVNLKIVDVNLKRDEFIVREKSGKARTVPLLNQARYWLAKYLAARVDMSSFLFVRHDRAAQELGIKNHELRNSLKPLTPRSVQRLVEKYTRAAGIMENVTPKIVRHSYRQLTISH